jgi:hypothetical protein
MDKDLALQLALCFTHEDLKANREGYMTFEQRRYLRERQWWKTLYGLAFLAFLSFLVHVALNYSTQSTIICMPPLYILYGVCGIIGIIVGIAAIFAYQSLTKKDTFKGLVSAASGKVVKKKYPQEFMKTTRWTYVIEVGGQILRVSAREFDAFDESPEYRIYYAPNTRTLLSAERV